MARRGETKIFNSSVSLAVSSFSGLSRAAGGFKPFPPLLVRDQSRMAVTSNASIPQCTWKGVWLHIGIKTLPLAEHQLRITVSPPSPEQTVEHSRPADWRAAPCALQKFRSLRLHLNLLKVSSGALVEFACSSFVHVTVHLCSLNG